MTKENTTSFVLSVSSSESESFLQLIIDHMDSLEALQELADLIPVTDSKYTLVQCIVRYCQETFQPIKKYRVK